MARARQLTLFRKRRKPGPRPRPGALLSHKPRERLSRRWPLHVTLRVRDHVFGLRSRRAIRVIEAALRASRDRFDPKVVQVSVMGNHVHLIVEAGDHLELARAMQGLCIRIAKGLNKMMRAHGVPSARGRVFADRYHAHVLRTPAEVRHALAYVRTNHRHHFGSPTTVDAYSSDGILGSVVAVATHWLLTHGHHRRARGGLLPEEIGEEQVRAGLPGQLVVGRAHVPVVAKRAARERAGGRGRQRPALAGQLVA
jgi:REP element-mobilizing transposase RayT